MSAWAMTDRPGAFGDPGRKLRSLVPSWRERAERTDRDFSCANELDEVLFVADRLELRRLAAPWRAMARLTGGDDRCADELDQWIVDELNSLN